MALPTFTLDGFDLGGLDTNGTQWTVRTEQGWYGGPGVATRWDQRPSAHGYFDAPVWRTGRSVTIAGRAFGSDSPGALASRQAFIAVGPDGPVTLVGTDDAGSLSMQVGLADEPMVEWQTDRIFDWQITVVAPDPRKYGPALAAETAFPTDSGGLVFPLFTSPTGVLGFGVPGSSGTVSIANPGTAEATITATITGPVDDAGFDLTDVASGRRVRYGSGLGASDSLVIDFGSGLATINDSADRTGELVLADFWTVAAGGESTISFTPRGSATDAVATLSLKPAYW